MKHLLSRSSGVTIIELLVVIAIISIVAALLMTGLGVSRETARRMECSTHLRQIGLALHMYHGSHGTFPPGYVAAPLDDTLKWQEDYACYAWAAQLLPYLEQADLYDRLSISAESLNDRIQRPDAVELLAHPVPLFRCPSDLAGDTFETAPIWQPVRQLNRTTGGPPVYAATSSYAANCGYYEPIQPFSPQGGTVWSKKQRTSGSNNGPFQSGRSVSFAAITDGASNTVAVGERAFFQGSATWVGTGNILGLFPGGAGVCLGRTYWRINELPDPPGVLITPGSPEFISGETTAREAFGSYHPGGANFLFVDGSVRFLSELIESRSTTPANADVTHPVPDSHLLGAYQRLGIMNDGHTATPK